MAYHYRLAVPTGYSQEIRERIEAVDMIGAQVDGSIAAGSNDSTLLTVVSGELESLAIVKSWLDAQSDPIDITLITAIGTPSSVRDTEVATLRQMVMAHQVVGVEGPASAG